LKLHERVKDLIEELDRIHPDGYFNGQAWRMEDSLPDFVTAKNGHERHFTKKARTVLHAIAVTIHENDAAISSVVEIQNFGKLLRRCVADLHADGLLTLGDIQASQARLNESVRASIKELRTEFTHYFPASTLGMEADAPFVLGPVTFMTREQWIESVDFSQTVLERSSGTPEKNANWKSSLKAALTNNKQDEDPYGLAGQLYTVLRHCPSILKITIKGYEYDLSRKVGEIVCKTALDSISLLFGGREFFHQQALADERLQPIETYRLLESEGHLWTPSRTLGPRIRNFSHTRVKQELAKHPDVLDAFAYVLNALVEPANAKHPNLVKRWSTALDWMAEGQRDKNDAVALAKIASSLDVLACGGRFPGILALVLHLTKASPEDVVVKGLKPRTLRAVIKEIYDDGRSQILHGTHFDRLVSFEETKSHAAYFARLALLECVLRLQNFNGPDGDKEFRTMPR